MMYLQLLLNFAIFYIEVFMLSVWLFASKSLENIRVARGRLLWGFWDRDAGVKQRRNWRDFIRLFNRIKPFDIALFQITHTGNIHALGIVKNIL